MKAFVNVNKDVTRALSNPEFEFYAVALVWIVPRKGIEGR